MMHTKLLIGGGVLIIILLLFFVVSPKDVVEDTKSEILDSEITEVSDEPAEAATGGRGDIDIAQVFDDDAEQFDLSFAHVSPGVYSEVYAIVRGDPGTKKEVRLEGPGLESESVQIAVFGETGSVRLTWRINQYGEYFLLAKDDEDMHDIYGFQAVRGVIVN